MLNLDNSLEKMLGGYRKYPFMFTHFDNIELILTTLVEKINSWNEYGSSDKQYQFNVNRNELPLWNWLAHYINNVSVSQTHDLSHVTITYFDSFIEKVEELLTTGRVYLTA